jgi:hypothetical protein
MLRFSPSAACALALPSSTIAVIPALKSRVHRRFIVFTACCNYGRLNKFET